MVDLDTVFADDAFIDAIAAQTWGADQQPCAGSPSGPSSTGSSAGAVLTMDPLTEIFQSWRRELAVAPLPARPKVLQTDLPLPQRRSPSRSRALRPALVLAAAIAALLVGSASIGSKDVPRDSPLFALTEVLWPSRAASVASADQVGAILVEARFALDDGRPQDAQLALLRAATELGRVEDVDGKSDMQQRVAALWVQAAPHPRPPQETSRHTGGQGSSPPTARGGRPSATQSSSSPIAPATQAAAAAKAPAAAQVAAGAVPGGSPNAAQVLSPIQAPPTGTLQAALANGWPSGSVVASSAVAGPVVNSVDTPTVAAAASSSAAEPSSPPPTTAAVPSVPSTPPGPTAPAEVPISDPPSATEQSPPSPTPSAPAQSVEASTPADASLLSVDTGATNSAANAQTESKVASIPLDPAAAGTGSG